MAPSGKKAEGKSGHREPALDGRIARALNHPLRVEILAALNERCLSPAELSGILDTKLSNLSYHVRVLRDYGCIEVVDREQVRGAMKTRYRATTRMFLDQGNWEKLSKETRSGISIAAVGEVIDRASKALEADTFDARTERAVITVKMDSDEQAWQEVSEIVKDAYERISDIESQTASRAGEKFRVTVSMLSYQSPED